MECSNCAAGYGEFTWLCEVLEWRCQQYRSC
jgi:hypothetical protein